jgi:hypothetical protein
MEVYGKLCRPAALLAENVAMCRPTVSHPQIISIVSAALPAAFVEQDSKFSNRDYRTSSRMCLVFFFIHFLVVKKILDICAKTIAEILNLNKRKCRRPAPKAETIKLH